MWIQLHKDRGKTYYDKRWGEGCSYTSVQFQHFLFSMHACLAVYALEGAEILKDGEKMLWSKTACGKVFSSNSSVPITLLFCTYVCHPIFFFWYPEGKGWTSSLEQTLILIYTELTKLTESRSKGLFVGKAEKLIPLKPLGWERRKKKSSRLSWVLIIFSSKYMFPTSLRFPKKFKWNMSLFLEVTDV